MKISTRFGDAEILQWADRHGLYLSSATDLRAAFEDARSLQHEDSEAAVDASPPRAQAIDLMAALKASLAQDKKK